LGSFMSSRRLLIILVAALWAKFALADAIIGGWAIEEKKDPITGDPWVIAQTEEADASGMWLQIRCEAKKPYLTIGITGANFPVDSQVEVIIRVDQSYPTLTKFKGVGEAGAVAAPLSRQTYSKLVVSKTIAFRAKYGNEIWSATFSPSQTSQAMEALLRAAR
jgi:hypothetical protein